jgi:hypothetical protein
MSQKNPRCVIGLLGACHNEKYRNQIDACVSTWVPRANAHDIPVIFLCGRAIGNLDTEKKYSTIHFNVEDDYASATIKHWYGLKYIYSLHPTADFYLMGGTDNYIVVKRLLKLLEDYGDRDKPQYMGAHGEFRTVDRLVFFHYGGAGNIISHKAMEMLIPYIDAHMVNWKHMATPNNLQDACDVSLACLCDALGVSSIVLPHLYACNWKGYFVSEAHKASYGIIPAVNLRCCEGKINYAHLTVCHYMNKEDMLTLSRLEDKLPVYDEIVRYYNLMRTTQSDIWEHIEVLYNYALKCNSVIECGVRTCVSTYAFLRALAERLGTSSEPPSLIGVDLQYHSNIVKVKSLATQMGITYEFKQGNDLVVPLPEKADIVFIDSWHVFGQLIRELARFKNIATKYIIMHDTTVDAEVGESIRNGWNVMEQSRESGIPIQEICKGIWPAVEKFLGENSDWKLEKRLTNCNGLTILVHDESRKDLETPPPMEDLKTNNVII